jgi:hypothetical protein
MRRRFSWRRHRIAQSAPQFRRVAWRSPAARRSIAPGFLRRRGLARKIATANPVWRQLRSIPMKPAEGLKPVKAGFHRPRVIGGWRTVDGRRWKLDSRSMAGGMEGDSRRWKGDGSSRVMSWQCHNVGVSCRVAAVLPPHVTHCSLTRPRHLLSGFFRLGGSSEPVQRCGRSRCGDRQTV